jgi:predicted RNA-binding Zn-ribbon protein involved in translation (DUF1610 family)
LKDFRCQRDAPAMYRCKKCDFSTPLMKHYVRHTKDFHHKVENEPKNVNMLVSWYKCDNCDFKAEDRLIWSRHVSNCGSLKEIKTKGEEEKLFSCNQCEFRSDYRNSLKYHITAKHTPLEEIDWFACEQCTYKSKKSHLFAKTRPRKTHSKSRY